MTYSETRIVIGDLSQVLILIFIAKLIKVEFGVKNEEKTWNVLRAS